MGRRVEDEARRVEGHAVRALKYQADEFVLRRIEESLGVFMQEMEDESAVLWKISLAGEGWGAGGGETEVMG